MPSRCEINLLTLLTMYLIVNLILLLLLRHGLIKLTLLQKLRLPPPGYKLCDHPRPDRTGGGTAIVFRDTLCITKLAADVLNSFEYSEWKIVSGSFRVHFVLIYRPLYSTNHPVTINTFIVEFSQYLETIIMSTDPLITGDFNIHVNSKTDGDSMRFVDLLLSMSLQHVEFSTHVSGNILDLGITREVDSILGSPPRPGHLFSDHMAIWIFSDPMALSLILPNHLLQRNV